MLNCSTCLYDCRCSGGICRYYAPCGDDEEVEFHLRNEEKRRAVYRREWEIYTGEDGAPFVSEVSDVLP